ncbi:hypothetical protein [Kordiimonas aestuarii]|uniref:hypothetical protein n=1 Tax=Kordiimonas aestuarii TaxID=1005925 RepID=UPI0021CED38F|nr:hypothetical protein [Kordiimonas aestuarii]
MLKTALAAFFAITFNSVPAPAQQAAPPPSPCKTDEAFKGFDFWVGEWKVSGRANGKYAGNNSITKIEGDCALYESWNGQGGSTGKSVNYYNPITKKWRQLWVSGGAYSLDIEGGLSDGSMVMEGTIWYYTSGATAPFRGTWTPNDDGSVRQFFEQYDAEKKEWQPWFDGLYEPVVDQ